MLVVFDLDGTLAKVGEGAEAETVALLHKIRGTGARIALSSGKPTFYLCAFARQLGIQDAVLVGENGSVIQVGTSLPPTVYHKAEIPVITKEALKTLRGMLEEEFGDRIWYQPNETALTPFPAYQEDFPKIRAILDSFLIPEMEIKVYEHPDCFDILIGQSSFQDCFMGNRHLGLPDFVGIVLYPASLGINLCKFFLRNTNHVAFFIVNNATGAGGSLI